MYMSLSQVTKRYGQRAVLKDISIEVAKGELLALLGPSGCGKTTLLNALAGLVPIDGGEISIDGTICSRAGFTVPPETRNIGMVFQDFALWPHMTVFDNIAFGLRVRKVPRHRLRDRVMEVLETVRMDGFEHRFPHQLSGGQKQRVAIARALAPSPAVLLMDEPLSSLDAKLREEMRWQLMDIVRATGVTSIYVTHDQVEALSMADRIMLLQDGRIEQTGTPTELYARPETEFCASFIGAANLHPCKVSQRTKQWVSVDFHGIPVRVASEDLVRHDSVMLMVRPSELQRVTPEFADGDAQSGGSAPFECIIEQRAFHGTGWQYRVKVLGISSVSLEWWDTEQRDLGATIWLRIPPQAAKLVRSTRTPQLL